MDAAVTSAGHSKGRKVTNTVNDRVLKVLRLRKCIYPPLYMFIFLIRIFSELFREKFQSSIHELKNNPKNSGKY
jgi:hypothetical protein